MDQHRRIEYPKLDLDSLHKSKSNDSPFIAGYCPLNGSVVQILLFIYHSNDNIDKNARFCSALVHNGGAIQYQDAAFLSFPENVQWISAQNSKAEMQLHRPSGYLDGLRPTLSRRQIALHSRFVQISNLLSLQSTLSIAIIGQRERKQHPIALQNEGTDTTEHWNHCTATKMQIEPIIPRNLAQPQRQIESHDHRGNECPDQEPSDGVPALCQTNAS